MVRDGKGEFSKPTNKQKEKRTEQPQKQKNRHDKEKCFQRHGPSAALDEAKKSWENRTEIKATKSGNKRNIPGTFERISELIRENSVYKELKYQ